MGIKYEYKSPCCGHNYIEIRESGENIFFPICNKCGTSNYELVTETSVE